MLPIVLSITIAIIAFVVALKIARQVQKAVDKAGRQAREGKKSSHSWMGHIHSIWMGLGAAGAGLKYVYREWKTAPPGSWEKFGWSMLLAAVVAIGWWLIIRIVDRMLNGAPSPANELTGISDWR